MKNDENCQSIKFFSCFAAQRSTSHHKGIPMPQAGPYGFIEAPARDSIGVASASSGRRRGRNPSTVGIASAALNVTSRLVVVAQHSDQRFLSAALALSAIQRQTSLYSILVRSKLTRRLVRAVTSHNHSAQKLRKSTPLCHWIRIIFC